MFADKNFKNIKYNINSLKLVLIRTKFNNEYYDELGIPCFKWRMNNCGEDIENFEILGNELDENNNCLENFLLLEITINIIQNWNWNKTDSEMNWNLNVTELDLN